MSLQNERRFWDDVHEIMAATEAGDGMDADAIEAMHWLFNQDKGGFPEDMSPEEYVAGLLGEAVGD